MYTWVHKTAGQVYRQSSRKHALLVLLHQQLSAEIRGAKRSSTADYRSKRRVGYLLLDFFKTDYTCNYTRGFYNLIGSVQILFLQSDWFCSNSVFVLLTRDSQSTVRGFVSPPENRRH